MFQLRHILPCCIIETSFVIQHHYFTRVYSSVKELIFICLWLILPLIKESMFYSNYVIYLAGLILIKKTISLVNLKLMYVLILRICNKFE